MIGVEVFAVGLKLGDVLGAVVAVEGMETEDNNQSGNTCDGKHDGRERFGRLGIGWCNWEGMDMKGGSRGVEMFRSFLCAGEYIVWALSCRLTLNKSKNLCSKTRKKIDKHIVFD